MSLLYAVLLGAVQGLTEFLPISSDGHLVVFSQLFPLHLEGKNALGFDVLLHAASLLALLLLYARTWWRLLRSPFNGDHASRRLLFLLMLSVIPGAIAGLLLEDVVALRLRTMTAAGLGFLCTAFVLILGERLGKAGDGRNDGRPTGVWQVLLLGIAQAIAILPGVSRSGLTISAGRLLGLSRPAAVDMSFLMAVPIIGGAVAKIFLDALTGAMAFPPPGVAVAGFVSTFLVSVCAILILRALVRQNSLSWFAWYLIPLGFFLLFHFSGMRMLLEWKFLLWIVGKYGPLVVFPFCLIETVPPLSFVSPGVFLLIIAGSTYSSWTSLFLTLVAATAGLSLGNALLFHLGRSYGHSLGHFLHLTDERLKRIESFMRRFGRINVFLGQFVGIIRPGVAFVAGAAQMPPGRYYSWMIFSSVVWSACYIGLGYVFGRHAPDAMPALALGGVVLYATGIIALIVEMHLNRRRNGH